MINRFCLWAALVAGAALLTPHALGQGYTLVWADEFSQPNGSVPDSTKWGYDIGGGGYGNNELQTYTSRTNNCRIEDGMLVIEAHKETLRGPDNITRNYTSSRIKTQNKASWTYGRIEGRMKIPRGQGIWPAFWMLGANFSSVGWPACGEIDIMENVGSVPSRVHGTIHGPGYSGGNGIGGSSTLSGGAFADDFHVYAIEWETNRIRWFVDGEVFFTATPRSLPAGATWVFTQPQFLILNLAVGGNWPGAPNDSTVFPQRLVVDYVRVYAPTNEASCGGNVLTNPGFEAGAFGEWSAYGSGFNTSIESSPTRSGTGSLKVFGQFNGGENYSGVYQDRPCAPGDVFAADGWLLTLAGDRIAGANTAWLEVSFRNGAGTILGLHRSGLLTASSTTDSWIHLPVTNTLNTSSYSVTGTAATLTAPPDSTFVRSQVVFRQLSNAAGAVYVDDVALVAPGPSEFPVPVMLSSPGQMHLSFPTVLGANYEVQYKESLASAPWSPLATLAGTGTVRSFEEVPSAIQRFYRVIRLCN